MPFKGGRREAQYITLNGRRIRVEDSYRIFRVGKKDVIISETLLGFDVEQSFINGDWYWTKDGCMRQYEKDGGSVGYELLHRYLMACGPNDVIEFFDELDQTAQEKWNCQRHVMQLRVWNRHARQHQPTHRVTDEELRRQVSALLREADDYDTTYEVERSKGIFARLADGFKNWLDSR